VRVPWRSTRRVSVVAYLVTAFTICVLALAALMALTTASSFQRERTRAQIELQSAARDNANQAAQQSTQTVQYMQGMADLPGVRSLDAAQCRTALSGLSSLLNGQEPSGYLEVYRGDGSLVCGLYPTGVAAPAAASGAWFTQVTQTKKAADGGMAFDAILKRPAMTIALPVLATNGTTAVMRLVFGSSSWAPLQAPPGAVKETVLIEMDPKAELVLSTSANSPVKVGKADPAWASQLGNGTRTVHDPDGIERMYVGFTAANGWHVYAGLPKAVAVASARAELRRNLIVGLAVMVLVIGLGVILERRLARPIRKLRRTIAAASRDSHVHAEVAGPSEVAALATAFNETIDQRRELEQQLTHQALHDPLTGLPNRALLDDRLQVALARKQRNGRSTLCVLFLDLDRFKVINDSYGHERGDQVLVAIGERLSQALRPGDTVARFGGDEFVVLAEGIRDEAHAIDVASRLQEAIEEPIEAGGAVLHATATIGLALAVPGSTSSDLLRDADAAMYRGKELTRGSVEIFDENLGARARTRAETENALRLGLRNREFVVQYQPEVDVRTGRMTGVEALVRWQHPERGLVGPNDFIPVAEESGLISDLGDFVLADAARNLVEWQAAGLDLTIAVNLSPRQLTDVNLPARVAAILADSGAPADRIVLEMTESALVEDDPRTLSVLDGLKAMGVRLALDDFGTGYASLSYLRTFPVDVVKVDRSFVGDIDKTPGGAAIVAAVLAMGEGLGLVTVAEGVEHVSQLQALDRMGCRLAQGFYLAMPQDADAIAKLAGRDLRRRRRRATASAA
jgi:diguanylate cyclase (GGDEF)-like protein